MTSCDAAADAALLSRAVGKPVRVQSMRHEGTGWDPKAPASVHTSSVALDADNKIIGKFWVAGAARSVRKSPKPSKRGIITSAKTSAGRSRA